MEILRIQLELETCNLVEKPRRKELEESFVLFMYICIYVCRVQALGKAEFAKE